MFKHILVPIVIEKDQPLASTLAAAKALKDEGTKITFLHVIEEISGYVALHVPDGFVQQSQKDMTDKLKEVAQNIPGSETVVIHGHSARSILQYAEQNACDCIVVLSHTPGVQDIFLGSTAARLVRYAKCSVHVVR